MQRQTPRRRPSPDANSTLQRDSRLFVRNRTLVGTQSAAVQAASEASAPLRSPRVELHQLIRRRRRAAMGLMVALVVAVGAGLAMWQLATRVIVVGTGPVAISDQTRYTKAIDDYLAGRPLERLRFLLDRATLAAHLQAANPEVEAIASVDPAGLGVAQLRLVMRQPLVAWRLGNQQYYVDGKGVPFTTNYYPAPRVEIVDESGVRLQAGQAIASHRFLSYVGRTIAAAATHGLVVERVVIPAGTTRQILVSVQGYGYPARLSIDRPANAQVSDMARAYRHLRAHGQNPSYIDVRVASRVYYR